MHKCVPMVVCLCDGLIRTSERARRGRGRKGGREGESRERERERGRGRGRVGGRENVRGSE